MFLSDPDPDSSGGQFITDQAGSGFYLDIFVANEKICCQIGTVVPNSLKIILKKRFKL
jgi:hypothetical protein